MRIQTASLSQLSARSSPNTLCRLFLSKITKQRCQTGAVNVTEAFNTAGCFHLRASSRLKGLGLAVPSSTAPNPSLGMSRAASAYSWLSYGPSIALFEGPLEIIAVLNLICFEYGTLYCCLWVADQALPGSDEMRGSSADCKLGYTVVQVCGQNGPTVS